MEKLVSSWYNVQPLPDNYILPPDARPGKLDVPLCTNIPVIDMGGAEAEAHDRASIIQQMLNASEEFGFFQVASISS